MMNFVSRILLIGMLFCIFSCSIRDQSLDKYEYEQLLKLMDKRLQVAPLVAKSKWNTKAPIDDPMREKIILDSVEIKAGKLSIDKHFAHDFFQAQFGAGKMKQRQLHEKWEAQNQIPFNPAPDLGTEVRPILDNLTPLLLIELKKIKQNSCSNLSLTKLKLEARKIIDPTFDDKIIEIAVKPIETYCKKK